MALLPSIAFSGWAASLVGVLVDKVSNIVITQAEEDAYIEEKLDEELMKLKRAFSRIQSVPDNIISSELNSREVCVWMRRLRSVAYDAEILADEIETDRLMQQLEMIDQVSSHYLSSLVDEITTIRKRLDGVLSDFNELHLEGFGKKVESYLEGQETSSVQQSEVFFRETERDELLKMLLSDYQSRNQDIISVFGMTGLGKTTLVQIVYNDNQIHSHFGIKMWVSAHKVFDVKQLTRSAIESGTGTSCGLCDLESLQTTLQKMLREKKFLLVLDGVWHDRREDWDLFRAPLRVGLPGSKVLITTQSSIVATNIGMTYLYHMPGLRRKGCWALFAERAFGDKEANLTSEFFEIGSNIVERCERVPLLVKTFGSYLFLKHDIEVWKSVSKSEILDLQEDRNEILTALKLSYFHLPSHLKRCFAYCAVLPRDCTFERDQLIQMWMAEGFLQHIGRMGMEDVGGNYFDELVERSFFEVKDDVSRNDDRKGKPMYKMNTLIHILARYVSADECLTVAEVDDKSYELQASKFVRYVSLLRQDNQLDCLRKFENVSTFLLLCGRTDNVQYVPTSLFEELKFLRVLNLSHSHITILPGSICGLKHLRYLNINDTLIETLPIGFGKLYNLQTLKIRNCPFLSKLPSDMGDLINLLHLHIDERSLFNGPFGMENLIRLRELLNFVVTRTDGFRVRELKDMTDLRNLCISDLDNVPNKEAAGGAMLKNKEYLQNLELQWSKERDYTYVVDLDVLEGLEPHKKLKKLVVRGYAAPKFPSWISDSAVCNLVDITLDECNENDILQPLGELRNLKNLSIYHMNGLVKVDRKIFGGGKFPVLQSLSFSNLSHFSKWTDVQEGDFPHLNRLLIGYCPKFKSLPALHLFKLLKHLEFNSCNQLADFPETGLPSSLESLIVNKCSFLADKCRLENTREWRLTRKIKKLRVGAEVLEEGKRSGFSYPQLT